MRETTKKVSNGFFSDEQFDTSQKKKEKGLIRFFSFHTSAVVCKVRQEVSQAVAERERERERGREKETLRVNCRNSEQKLFELDFSAA